MAFIRKIIVRVAGQEFEGTGSDNDYKIGFSIQKHIVGSPNTATITINNLAIDRVDGMQERGLPVEVEAGHLDDGTVLVFRGETLKVVPSRQGPDIVTTITALDGGQAITFARKIKTYDQVAIATIVEDLANEVVAQIPGGTIGVIDVAGDTGYKGYAVSASAQNELDRLAKNFQFSWSVQDGVFNAIDDNNPLDEVWEISKRTALQHARKLTSGSLQANIGVEIQAFMNPRILPGHQVQLIRAADSSFTSDIAGTYKVHNIELTGDTHEDVWNMSLQCFTVGGF